MLLGYDPLDSVVAHLVDHFVAKFEPFFILFFIEVLQPQGGHLDFEWYHCFGPICKAERSFSCRCLMSRPIGPQNSWDLIRPGTFFPSILLLSALRMALLAD